MPPTLAFSCFLSPGSKAHVFFAIIPIGEGGGEESEVSSIGAIEAGPFGSRAAIGSAGAIIDPIIDIFLWDGARARRWKAAAAAAAAGLRPSGRVGFAAGNGTRARRSSGSGAGRERTISNTRWLQRASMTT